MRPSKTRPVIHHRCRERRVVGISFGQAEAAPCAEDEGQVAGVAFEVFAIGVAIRVGGGLGGVAEGLGVVNTMGKECAVVVSRGCLRSFGVLMGRLGFGSCG